jgi:predicted transposase/invertase (TIGR01784 family)
MNTENDDRKNIENDETGTVNEIPARPRYINPHTDFGFKRLFGTEANKDILQNFLQALLKSKDKITGLSYLNAEQLGRSEDDRKAVYDIYCETEHGEKFIVEMQRAPQDFFIDRSIFYSTFPIQAQAKRGEKWDFKLNAIYTVGILNFTFKENKEDKEYQHIHHVQLSDTETKKVFYDKLTYVYIELPKFNLREDELKTMLDKWTFVLKNLSNLTDRPKALQETVFKHLFKLAEIEQMSEPEKWEYFKSEKNYWDYTNTMDFAQKKVAKAKDKIIRKIKQEIQEKDLKIQEKEQEIEQLKQENEQKTAAIIEKFLVRGSTLEEIANFLSVGIEEIEKIRVKYNL